MHRHLRKIGAICISAYLVAALNLSQGTAADYSTGQLVIAHPWAPPTLGKQRIGVVYFTLRNQGPDTDRLLAIDLPDGGQAQMHDSQMQDGVMRMRPADAVLIPPGGEFALQPGGMHVMLTDLPGPLIKGGRIKLILRFEKAGPVEAEAAIEPRAAAPSAPSPHQGH